MRNVLRFTLFCVLLTAPARGALTVENSQASQRAGTELRGGSRYVDIYYDVTGTTASLTVSVLISNDDGVTWNVGPTTGSLSGDIGAGVLPGIGKHIVWDAGTDRPNVFWEKTKARVTATEEPGAGAAEITVILPGDVPITLVRIPKGTFMMGSPETEQDHYSDEEPQHQVTLTHDYYMGKYEVTKAQWAAVMGTTPWVGYSYVLNEPDSPAVYVSWDDINGAGGFMEKLNEHLGTTGQPYRLPTEAEWEYACRANTTTRFYWGDDPNYTEINDYAWWHGNAHNVGKGYAHIVGTKLPNTFGLYDMSGNVWEWCQDGWHDDYTGSPVNGSAWGDGTYPNRVLRGGGWGNYGRLCRSADRGSPYPADRRNIYGFRIVRTQD